MELYCCRGGTRTHVIQIMSLTSYQLLFSAIRPVAFIRDRLYEKKKCVMILNYDFYGIHRKIHNQSSFSRRMADKKNKMQSKKVIICLEYREDSNLRPCQCFSHLNYDTLVCFVRRVRYHVIKGHAYGLIFAFRFFSCRRLRSTYAPRRFHGELSATSPVI